MQACREHPVATSFGEGSARVVRRYAGLHVASVPAKDMVAERFQFMIAPVGNIIEIILARLRKPYILRVWAASKGFSWPVLDPKTPLSHLKLRAHHPDPYCLLDARVLRLSLLACTLRTFNFIHVPLLSMAQSAINYHFPDQTDLNFLFMHFFKQNESSSLSFPSPLRCSRRLANHSTPNSTLRPPLPHRVSPLSSHRITWRDCHNSR